MAFFCPPPFIKPGAAGPATCAFQGAGVPDGSASIAAGAAAADRYVFVFLDAFRSASFSLSSATIAGQTAKIHVQRGQLISSVYWWAGLISAPVPSGTSVVVSPTWSAAPQANSRVCSVYRVTGLVSDDAVATRDFQVSGLSAWSEEWPVQQDGFSLANLHGTGHSSRVVESPQMTTDYTYENSTFKAFSWSCPEPATLASKEFDWDTSSSGGDTNTGVFVSASFR